MQLPSELVAALQRVRSMGVITGAGVSAESGIQTYRGRGGIYDDAEEGDRTVEALTGATLLHDPDLTWRTVAGLARQAHQAQPNSAHYAIAELETLLQRFVLLTQNVDGFHQQAGSRNVIDIHGSVTETQCMECAVPGRMAMTEVAELTQTPLCQQCGGRLRPNAVLFGELLPTEKIAQLQQEFHHDPPDMVIAAGTSALFPYIVEPLITAARNGKFTVEINPERTPASEFATVRLIGGAGEYLPAMVELLRGRD